MTVAGAAATLAVGSKSMLLPTILDIGRGGALTAAASLVSSTILKTSNDPNLSSCTSISRGGGRKGNDEKQSSITPQGLSVLYMAIAMSLHYLSYSIARPSTIALFTSAKTGFAGNTAAFPLAMAFISPTSLSLLFIYGKILGKAGPKGAIRQTTLIVAAVLWSAALCVQFLSKGNGSNLFVPLFGFAKIPILQALVGVLFIFRESYVQLLTSQYWSFMASILTPDQSAKWFSPISGLTSITSAIAGLGVKQVVDNVGLPGSLGEDHHDEKKKKNKYICFYFLTIPADSFYFITYQKVSRGLC